MPILPNDLLRLWIPWWETGEIQAEFSFEQEEFLELIASLQSLTLPTDPDTIDPWLDFWSVLLERLQQWSGCQGIGIFRREYSGEWDCWFGLGGRSLGKPEPELFTGVVRTHSMQGSLNVPAEGWGQLACPLLIVEDHSPLILVFSARRPTALPVQLIHQLLPILQQLCRTAHQSSLFQQRQIIRQKLLSWKASWPHLSRRSAALKLLELVETFSPELTAGLTLNQDAFNDHCHWTRSGFVSVDETETPVESTTPGGSSAVTVVHDKLHWKWTVNGQTPSLPNSQLQWIAETLAGDWQEFWQQNFVHSGISCFQTSPLWQLLLTTPSGRSRLQQLSSCLQTSQPVLITGLEQFSAKQFLEAGRTAGSKSLAESIMTQARTISDQEWEQIVGWLSPKSDDNLEQVWETPPNQIILLNWPELNDQRQQELIRIGHSAEADHLAWPRQMLILTQPDNTVTKKDSIPHLLGLLKIEFPFLSEWIEEICCVLPEQYEALWKPIAGAFTWTEPMLQQLRIHHWHGGISELQRLLEQIASSVDVATWDEHHLYELLVGSQEIPRDHADGELAGLTDATLDFQRLHIRKAIHRASGNMTEAARLLGLHRSNLYRKMSQLQMSEAEIEEVRTSDQ